MMNAMRKIENLKASGPDYVQGYWLKSFQSMLKNLREKLQYYVDNGNVLESMTVSRNC